MFATDLVVEGAPGAEFILRRQVVLPHLSRNREEALQQAHDIKSLYQSLDYDGDERDEGRIGSCLLRPVAPCPEKVSASKSCVGDDGLDFHHRTGQDIPCDADEAQGFSVSPSVPESEDFLVDRFELLVSPTAAPLAAQIRGDIASISPETDVRIHALEFANAWDFEEVYGKLGDFADGYRWRPEHENYYLHITTGTHVAQICLFLLCETRAMPGRLLQSSPARKPERETGDHPGRLDVIDLELAKYDRLAARFRARQHLGASLLKAGIDTRNAEFNRLIEQLEQVATRSRDPILLTGETGTGKFALCRQIYELKRVRQHLAGELVEVNCATLRNDLRLATSA